MANICIFSGAAVAHSQSLNAAVVELIQTCVARGHTIINGGMGAGMMQLVGQTTLAAGGNMRIIYPTGMTKHEAHHTHQFLTHQTVKNLHDRLEHMTDQSDIFIALPGGIGTLHEIFQVWADVSLSYHAKPLLIFNHEGFYDPLQTLMDHTLQTGYIRHGREKIATFHPSLESLLAALA